MIVISKKRIGIILASVLIGVFAFSFQIASNKTSKFEEITTSSNLVPTNTNAGETTQTTATPVSGKTIVVDARTRSSR